MHVSKSFIRILLVIILLPLFCPKIEAQQPATYRLMKHVCPDKSTFSRNSTYRSNLISVLSSLRSNISLGNSFYNYTLGRSPNVVYALFLCRGDVPASVCDPCVAMAVINIEKYCPNGTTMMAWYNECLLRYSNKNIFSILAEKPEDFTCKTKNIIRNATEQNRLNNLLTTQLKDAANQAANQPPGAKKFATRQFNFSSKKTLYALVQCTPDLSGMDCNRCLHGAIANLSKYCVGRLGGRVWKPSCNIRYDTNQFYDHKAVTTEKQHKSKWITILVASLSSAFGLAVVSVYGLLIWRRRDSQADRENSQEVQLLDLIGGRLLNEHSGESSNEENIGKSQEFPSIQLDILHAATNHFCSENKIGEGGFGPVYKGTVIDGKEIAVKRLSRTSGQGLVEFKNEIVLIAKLQHRNLVRLLGCCLEQNEKLLVYEFMPNGSLDKFLFDSIMDVQLDWQKRFNIINGIARGIMYLHEDSRLRIIHRDLKASNVLLDDKMNPKISDFGMARIFGEDKDEANTIRVVGTYGYMAPEYAMQGLFSIKSDVFSFGVLLLEIISGKKNNTFHLSENGESLLTFAWKLWSRGEGMGLTDEHLVASCVASEVLKCIHIGLLCVQEDPADRPTISSVIFMLTSDATIMLPRPSQPAFSVGRVIAKPIIPISNTGLVTVNDVTISNILPR